MAASASAAKQRAAVARAGGSAPARPVSGQEDGHISVTERLALARAKLQAAEAEAGPDFKRTFAALAASSAALWLLLLLARWRLSDAERLRALEERTGGAFVIDLLGSRIAAHLGPFQVPNFVRARLHERPLETLSRSRLRDYERVHALSRLGQITQRPAAAAAVLSASAALGEGTDAPLLLLEPVFREVFAPERGAATVEQTLELSSSTSHLDSAVGVVFDAVLATPSERRAVPDWVLHGLVEVRGTPWTDNPRGEELRALLLLHLLRSPENCRKAVALPEVMDYAQRPGFKAKADTFFPIRAYLLSGETPDLLRRSTRLLGKNCPGSVEVQQRLKRDTPTLQTKHDLRSLWTTALLTVGWAGLRAWSGAIDVPAMLALGRACGSALAGMGVLEALWLGQELVIDTTWYYENEAAMLSSSAAMCLTNSAALAWACRFPVVVPFLVCRLLKDDLMDAHRTFM